MDLLHRQNQQAMRRVNHFSIHFIFNLKKTLPNTTIIIQCIKMSSCSASNTQTRLSNLLISCLPLELQ